MNSWELPVLAIIAVVVLFQLYNVLGRRVGFKAEDKVQAPKPDEVETTQRGDKVPDLMKLPNLDTLKTKDSNFNEINFLEKSRETYEQIVVAFNRGDIESLKDRLSDGVYSVFSKAIAARGDDKVIRVSFVDAPKADIDLIDFKDERAQVRVRFLSELVYETTKPTDEVGQADEIIKHHRRTAEYWTFQKNLKSTTNPWVLTKVEAAKA